MYSSNSSRKLSIFCSGISPLRNSRTTFTRYTRVLSDNVSPFGWTCLLYLCSASTMSESRFSFSFRRPFDDLCFIDSTWFLITLFFTESSSLHALQNSLPADTQTIISKLLHTVLGGHWFSTVQAEPPFERFWPTGGGFVDTFLFLANSDGTGDLSLSSNDRTLLPSDTLLSSSPL